MSSSSILLRFHFRSPLPPDLLTLWLLWFSSLVGKTMIVLQQCPPHRQLSLMLFFTPTKISSHTQAFRHIPPWRDRPLKPQGNLLGFTYLHVDLLLNNKEKTFLFSLYLKVRQSQGRRQDKLDSFMYYFIYSVLLDLVGQHTDKMNQITLNKLGIKISYWGIISYKEKSLCIGFLLSEKG